MLITCITLWAAYIMKKSLYVESDEIEISVQEKIQIRYQICIFKVGIS